MFGFLLKLLLTITLVVGVIVLLAYLIETDEEAIERLLRYGLERVSAGDVDGAMSCVSPNFDYAGRNYTSLRLALVDAMPLLSQYDHTLARFAIQARERLAEVDLQVFSQPRGKDAAQPVLTTWQVGLQKKDGKWLITELDQQ